MAANPANMPTNEFGFISEPVVIPMEVWLGAVSQLALAIAILALTLMYFVRRRRLAGQARTHLLQLRLRQIKYLSALALVIGACVTAVLAYRALVTAAIAYSGFDLLAVPLAEAMPPFVYGMMIAGFG